LFLHDVVDHLRMGFEPAGQTDGSQNRWITIPSQKQLTAIVYVNCCGRSFVENSLSPAERGQRKDAHTFSCSVREGKKIVASEDKSVGPPIVVTRGEPTEITVVNHLDAPTTIHWHGLELDAYYDGVIGGGDGNQITPAIQAGASFVARFTPNRAGTFIYHTHAADPNQLSGGVYGGLIVLEPGESFDA
jgi:FtsP/CotA-like multicopper oxidase with cupredoxin domain